MPTKHSVNVNLSDDEKKILEEVRSVFKVKDIIEKLGWIKGKAFYWEWPIKNTIYVEEFSSRCLDFRLNYVNDNKYVIIEAYERNALDWETIFCGPIRKKKDLKYIMKLFNMIK